MLRRDSKRLGPSLICVNLGRVTNVRSTQRGV